MATSRLLFPFLAFFLLLHATSSFAGLTIPLALLCVDPNLEQELLAGVTLPAEISSIVSELAVARLSICGWGPSSTVTSSSWTAGAAGASTTALTSTGGGGGGASENGAVVTSSATYPSPLATPSLPSTSSWTNFSPSASPSSSSRSSDLPSSTPSTLTVVSAVPSLTTTVLAPSLHPTHLLPILLGVLLPLALLLLLLLLLFLLFRRRRQARQQTDPSADYPYLSTATTHSDASSQQPFWAAALRRPKFNHMVTSSSTGTEAWDPLPLRPARSQSTLAFSSAEVGEMSEPQRRLYLVGTQPTPLPTPGLGDHSHDNGGAGGFPWGAGAREQGAGESEVEIGGGRLAGKAVEIKRGEDHHARPSFESAGTGAIGG